MVLIVDFFGTVFDCIYVKHTTMRKLFLFILIVLGLSSCTGWYYASSYDTSYSDYRYSDYRYSNYRPYSLWTDVIYSPYYSRYYSNFTFGYSSYYGFYGYYGYPYYDYYNYYALYNHHYYKHYKHNNYAYTYPQKKVVNKPVYRRSTTAVSSRVDKPKTYPTRRSSVKPTTNGRSTNRYTNSPTRQRTYTRPAVKSTERRTNTYRSSTAVKRNNQPVKKTYRPTQRRSTPVNRSVRPSSTQRSNRSVRPSSTQKRSVRPAPTQRRSVSPPVNRSKSSTSKRKN